MISKERQKNPLKKLKVKPVLLCYGSKIKKKTKIGWRSLVKFGGKIRKTNGNENMKWDTKELEKETRDEFLR